MRKSLPLILLVALAALVLVAGCGTDSSVSSGSGDFSGQVADMSAADIAAKAQEASKGVTSVTMTSDVDLNMKTDPSQAGSSDTSQLTSGPIKLHVEGSMATGTSPRPT